MVYAKFWLKILETICSSLFKVFDGKSCMTINSTIYFETKMTIWTPNQRACCTVATTKLVFITTPRMLLYTYILKVEFLKRNRIASCAKNCNWTSKLKSQEVVNGTILTGEKFQSVKEDNLFEQMKPFLPKNILLGRLLNILVPFTFLTSLPGYLCKW